MQQERWRGSAGHRDVRIQLKLFLINPQMPGIERHGEIRTTTFLICRVNGRVQAVVKMSAYRRHQMLPAENVFVIANSPYHTLSAARQVVLTSEPIGYGMAIYRTLSLVIASSLVA